MTPCGLFPIDRVRREFPALSWSHSGRPRVFMDNPAGTQLSRQVIDAVAHALMNAASNHGGFFGNSRNAEAIHAGAHRAMADFMNAHSPDEIVGARSMTALTLHVSRSLGRRWAPGDEIVVTRMDHGGNVSPWLLLAEDLDLVVRWLPLDRDTWKIEPGDLQALLGPRTRLVALNAVSNLTGSINDVTALAALARASGALTYVDAVQFAPHRCIDVQGLGCDFLACSSYKFFGPHLGALWGRRELPDELTAYKVRCAPEASPRKWETGTPQTELLAGLAACVDYLDWLGREVSDKATRRERIEAAYHAAADHEAALTVRLPWPESLSKSRAGRRRSPAGAAASPCRGGVACAQCTWRKRCRRRDPLLGLVQHGERAGRERPAVLAPRLHAFGEDR